MSSLHIVAGLFVLKQKKKRQTKNLWLFSLHRISAFELPVCLSVKNRYVHKIRKLLFSINIPFVFEVQMDKYSSTLLHELKTVV